MNGVPKQPCIVVGVDLSPASLAALRWAAREAEFRGARLHVVRACERAGWWVAPYVSHSHQPAAEEDRAGAVARLAEAVRTVLGPAPSITVTVEAAEGLAARVLLDRAATAELLVLGGATGAAQDTIGPVERACLHHQPCPVVVVSTKSTGISVPV